MGNSLVFNVPSAAWDHFPEDSTNIPKQKHVRASIVAIDWPPCELFHTIPEEKWHFNLEWIQWCLSLPLFPLYHYSEFSPSCLHYQSWNHMAFSVVNTSRFVSIANPAFTIVSSRLLIFLCRLWIHFQHLVAFCIRRYQAPDVSGRHLAPMWSYMDVTDVFIHFLYCYNVMFNT